MNTCCTCRYKGESLLITDNDNLEDVETGYFPCELIKHDKSWVYPKNQGAILHDGSGYHAALCVENDYGCNKWIAK